MDNKTQHDFISTVSHELRTPLTSIRGFAQTMLNSWDMLDDESKKQFIKIIEEQSNRLIKLVENILAVTKSQNTDNYVFKNIEPNSAIQSVLPIVQQQYPNKQIKTFFNKNLPEILIDKDKFQQIIMNLTENACKYSDENTEVTVKTDFADSNTVSIKITDTGIEIKDEDKDRIFEKFSRIDNPLTRAVQGSGLGLYITKTLVENMNGTITVESENHKTTFEVRMPICDIENQARAKCIQKH
ncbi:HAMP domain-containing histidine kinase [bacterium]|nr:HAMP domain-containing histidine kinase [bacterium]